MRTVGLIWRKDLQFESTLPSGASLTFDGDLGPQPVETMVAAIGACMAMDVMSILVKKRQSVSSYRMRVAAPGARHSHAAHRERIEH